MRRKYAIMHHPEAEIAAAAAAAAKGCGMKKDEIK